MIRLPTRGANGRRHTRSPGPSVQGVRSAVRFRIRRARCGHKTRRGRFRVRSDAIDQLLSTYLEAPARVSWKSALAESSGGHFEGVRLELAGVAVLDLPFERVSMEAEEFHFVPGLPASISATSPRLALWIGQAQLDRWLTRSRAPFDLRLTRGCIEFRLDLAGLPITRVETELSVDHGWFVLKPERAEFLGLQNRLASVFRTYIPLPRLAPETRLTGVEHAEGSLRIELTLDAFEEEVTPGLVGRIRERFLPFAGPVASWLGREGG